MGNTLNLEKKRELNKLKLFLIPNSEPIPTPIVDLYNKTYKLWHSVWLKTLKELNGATKLYSNEFTRHDFSAVICRDDTPVSLLCYSTIDLRLQTRKEDSWFSAWPQEALEKLASKSKFGLMPPWLSLHPKFRRSKSNYPLNLSQITVEIFAKVALALGCDLSFGTPRNNRGVHHLLNRMGGTKIGQSFAHNCEVDLLTFDLEDFNNYKDNFLNETNFLWNNKTDHWGIEKYERNYLQKTA